MKSWLKNLGVWTSFYTWGGGGDVFVSQSGRRQSAGQTEPEASKSMLLQVIVILQGILYLKFVESEHL